MARYPSHHDAGLTCVKGEEEGQIGQEEIHSFTQFKEIFYQADQKYQFL